VTAKAHFHVLGIPVRIEPFFWIASVLLAYNLGDARLIIMWVVVVLASVLVHELGHAVALKAFGQSSAIVLHGFGGLTFSQRKLDRARSIAVTLAGPFTALALLGIPERFADAALVGELLHDAVTSSRAQVAFDTACAWSRAGQPERGLDWVSIALADGFHAPGLLDGEPDLAAVRSLPRWGEVRSRLG
jgi:hypothetical protein